MLECSDGTFYTGSTNNLTLRLHQHQVGEGANYTKKRLPVKLVYSEEFERIDDAFYREKQVQGWNRKKKEALMRGDTELLKELSKSRAGSLSSAKASAFSPLSALASATSASSVTTATADKTAIAESAALASATSASSVTTATAGNADIFSRISITGESKAVAELAEAVEATNLLADDTAGKTTMASASSLLSAMASTGSATADKTATAENAATLSRISITGESMAVAEPVEATNLVGNATADKTSTPSTTKRLNN